MLDIPDSIKHDTFIQGISTIIQDLGKKIKPSYLFGRIGHGARLSVAMNTKRGREIGHPSGHYSWDIVGVTEHCFGDTGIDATVFVGPGYATRARKTAAQTERELPDNVVLLDDYELDLDHPIEGNLLYASDDGHWRVAQSTADFDVNWDNLQFGPVFLKVQGIEIQKGFPRSTFRYLVDTLERGEEPMEIRGRNNYSTVSGWKAFARWMQSYSVPLPGVQHPDLVELPDLLLERRQFFVEFLDELRDEVNNKEKGLLEGLITRYEPVVELLEELQDNELALEDVREIYYTEQKTLTYYKKIDTYLTHHRR